MKLNPNALDAHFNRHNQTIAISPTAAANLTLLTRRIYNVLLYFTWCDGEQPVHRRYLSEIRQLIAYNSTNLSTLKKQLAQLQNTQVTWSQPSGKNGTEWNATSLIARVTVHSEPGKESVVEWTMDEKLRAQLANPESYTTLSLQMHTQLKAGSSVALFEICARYASNPSHLTMSKPWEWWRPVLTGAKEKKDTEYKYFKRDVIIPAVSEINHLAKFTVELIEHRTGNRIDEIQFRVTPNEGEKNEAQEQLLERIKRLGVDEAQAQRLCATYMAIPIETALKITEKRQRSRAKAPLQNPAGFFIKALVEKYEEADDRAQEQGSLDLRDVKSEATNERVAFDMERRKAAFKLWKDMPTDEQKSTIARFVATNPPQVIRDLIKRTGLESPIARTPFSTWLADELWGEGNMVEDAQ